MSADAPRPLNAERLTIMRALDPAMHERNHTPKEARP